MPPDDARIDVDASTREVLDFDEVLGWVAESARTSPGRERLLAVVPWADAALVAQEAEAVRETAALLERDGPLVAVGLPDPGPALQAIAVEGAALDAVALRDLARVALDVGELASSLRRLSPEEAPRLHARAATVADLRREAQPILRAIEADGTLRDDASDELREVRSSRRTRTERLERQLLALAREPGSADVVRDDFVTQRNGRYVIPIRTDAPRAVPGVVHASSSSGATQFVEPLETVEANNEIIRLREREAREIERLLRAMTAGLARRRAELGHAVEVLGWIDSLQARVLWARDVGASLAEVAPGSPIRLDAARHPLLERRLAAAGRGCVPLDLGLDPADRVLVLSGPNAGGKTVALKTLGLAVLLAQAGIPVPARAVKLPIYRQVRADVGDHQSIAADLSTFTAHVRSVAGYLRDAAPPCLFLLDEAGSGTEPREGAALALAILEDLRRPGYTVAVTTHQAEIKTWAMTEPGVASAALEFDTVELRPTFRVRSGAAGVSAGLAIAARVGLPAGIVERAREKLGDAAARSEEIVERLREGEAELELRRVEIDRLVAAAREAREEGERALAEARRRAREEAALALERALAGFEQQSRKALAEIESKGAPATAVRAAKRVADRMRGEHRRILDALDPARLAGVAVEQPREGQRVYVVSLGKEGRVRAVRGRQVEILLGSVPFTVATSDLREATGDVPEPPVRLPAPRSTTVRDDENPQAEIHLLGRTVEEALDELDRFLDRAALASLAEVRVVHGHGTGRLRRAIRQFLDRHVHVSAHRPGGEREGGDGATVVTLR